MNKHAISLSTRLRRRIPLLGWSTLTVLAVIGGGFYRKTAPDRLNQTMIRAVAAGRIDLVQQYLAEGADPNTVFRYLDEPMESQGFSPHALWVRIRGGAGAPHLLNGPTALMKAVETRNPAMVQLLIRHGADVNKRGWYGWTPLSTADPHDVEIVQMLKQAGAKP